MDFQESYYYEPLESLNYPYDMSKEDFEAWCESLQYDEDPEL